MTWARALTAALIFGAWGVAIRAIVQAPDQAAPQPAAAAQPGIRAQGPDHFDQLVAFYHGCRPECLPKGRRHLLAQVVDWTEDAASRLCIEDQVETFLAIIHRESGFNPATDDGDSRQVAQVRRRYEARLRKAWAGMGVDIGPSNSVKASVYMGVLMFRDKLRAARGNVLLAVKSYNGRGDVAELYAYRVLASRGRIFGRVWTPGETATLLEDCPL